MVAMEPSNKPRLRVSTRPGVSAADLAEVGALVVGHGTRDAAGLAEFRAVVRRAAERLTPLPVEPAFLELAEPTIDAAVERLARRGIRKLVAAPLLLFAAGHVRRDVPEAVRAAAERAGLEPSHVGLAEHLGCDRRIVALSVRRFRESAEAQAAERAPVADGETLHLLVGRGSSEDEARDEFLRFAELRRQAGPCGAQAYAFAALSEPSLAVGLASAGTSTWRRVVVQPHLLFRGQLIDQIRAAVDEAGRRFPDKQWLTTAHLGAEPEVADVVCSRLHDLLGR